MSPCVSPEAGIIEGLYRAVGLEAGAAFSSEDVSVIYRKVFHHTSTTNEVLVAMKKVKQMRIIVVFLMPSSSCHGTCVTYS